MALGQQYASHPTSKNVIDSLFKPCKEEVNVCTKTKCLIVLNLILKQRHFAKLHWP